MSEQPTPHVQTLQTFDMSGAMLLRGHNIHLGSIAAHHEGADDPHQHVVIVVEAAVRIRTADGEHLDTNQLLTIPIEAAGLFASDLLACTVRGLCTCQIQQAPRDVEHRVLVSGVNQALLDDLTASLAADLAAMDAPPPPHPDDPDTVSPPEASDE